MGTPDIVTSHRFMMGETLPPLLTLLSPFPLLLHVTTWPCDIVLVRVWPVWCIWCIASEIDTLLWSAQIPGHAAALPWQGDIVCGTGRHNWRNFLADHVLLRPDLRQWNDQTNVKHIVFIWMFVGETLDTFVFSPGSLWVAGPGQLAGDNVTFISQPPSNQMSLFPTYLITVLIYGIISYQTQNLPQLKLWHSGPLHLAYEGFVFWVTFYFLTAPASCLGVTPQTAGQKQIFSAWFINGEKSHHFITQRFLNS